MALAESLAHATESPVYTEEIQFLTCHQCGKNSIPAPAGSTSRTKYICPRCSDVTEDDVHLDRCQFDNLPARLGSDSIATLDGHARSVAERPSARVLSARKRGLAWAFAMPEEICALPRAQRLSLLLVEFCELSRHDAAAMLYGLPVDCVGSTECKHLNFNLCVAKKKLESIK